MDSVVGEYFRKFSRGMWERGVLFIHKMVVYHFHSKVGKTWSRLERQSVWFINHFDLCRLSDCSWVGEHWIFKRKWEFLPLMELFFPWACWNYWLHEDDGLDFALVELIIWNHQSSGFPSRASSLDIHLTIAITLVCVCPFTPFPWSESIQFFPFTRVFFSSLWSISTLQLQVCTTLSTAG